jgi:hypothetical protein
MLLPCGIRAHYYFKEKFGSIPLKDLKVRYILSHPDLRENPNA